jgi:hypothetical protein
MLHTGKGSAEFWASLAATPASKTELENSMLRHYIRVFGEGPLGDALAMIPAVMMWDDHDINDGWGSYSATLQESPIFQRWYGAARKFFMLFQQHTSAESTAEQLKAHGFVAADASPAAPLSQILPVGPTC